MRYKGKIITWKDEKGFGFVTYDGSPDKVFVHINSFLSRSRRPVGGDQITFEVELDEQRRSKAINIKFADEKTREGLCSCLVFLSGNFREQGSEYLYQF